MSPREWRFRIEDIAEALSAIEEYTAGLDFAGWSRDRKTIDAVIRNFEIIGEAATNVPDEIQNRFSDLPWAQLKGIRNVLIHEYFGVDREFCGKPSKKTFLSCATKSRQSFQRFEYMSNPALVRRR